MTALTPDTTQAPSRTAHGIGCILLGMCLFAGQDAMMKSLLQVYPIWMLMFVRSCVTLLVLVPLILALGGPHRLVSPLWRLHLLRAALFAVGFSLFYTAFPFMGLAEVTTIFFSAPLMIAIMAAVFLKEHIGIHRVGALVVGFAGVLIAMNPGGDSFSWIALLPLTCAAFYAAGQVLARRIGDRESSLTVGLYTLTFTGPILLFCGWLLNATLSLGPEFHHLRWAFPAEMTDDLSRLLMLGIVGMVAYILLSRAYQVADASIVAPFDYSYLPIAAVMAWLLWGEVPPVTTLLGMALIILSGLYIGYRELHAARRKGEPVIVAETVTAPGSPHPQKIPEDQTWP